jgi:hypothetical protein
MENYPIYFQLMRSTCGACSDTQETIRGISIEARRENRDR